MSAKLWLGLMALVIVGVAVAGWTTSAIRWVASRPRWAAAS
jgi:hypothetical protein